MTIELVYRLRTCAAAMVDGFPVQPADAADLMIEASNLLDVPEPIGEPMEVLKTPQRPTAVTWGGELNATTHPCPSCSAVTARTVRRDGRRLMLTCPTCEHRWEYGK